MGIEPVINGGLSFAAVLVLMALNIPIGIAMLVVGFIGFALISGFDPAIFVLGTAPFDAVSKYTLSVLPLFVLMGNLANSSNLSRNLYDAAYAVVGHYKGGLAMSTVGACAGFGMICGSSIATAATMSQMAGPEMRRHGYSDALISGSIASGGTLGIIIPPSVILVIYAYLTEQSVQELFFAALIPGLIAVIFESRPNVASDVAALCIKSGNSVILKGGKEAKFTTESIIKIIKDALKETNIDHKAVTSLNDYTRQSVNILLKMDKYVDVLVPRGGKSLIENVKKTALFQSFLIWMVFVIHT